MEDDRINGIYVFVESSLPFRRIHLFVYYKMAKGHEQSENLFGANIYSTFLLLL